MTPLAPTFPLPPNFWIESLIMSTISCPGLEVNIAVLALAPDSKLAFAKLRQLMLASRSILRLPLTVGALSVFYKLLTVGNQRVCATGLVHERRSTTIIFALRHDARVLSVLVPGPYNSFLTAISVAFPQARITWPVYAEKPCSFSSVKLLLSYIYQSESAMGDLI